MNGPLPNKCVIARNFSRTALGYENWAVAQNAIAVGLAKRLSPCRPPCRIVDLGCGTGLLSGLLLKQYPGACLTGLDLAPGMIALCCARWKDEPRARFLVADAETIPAHEPSPDLVACSCSAQWFADAEETLTGWAGLLAPGGVLACAFLIRGSFCELASAYHEATHRPFPGLRLPDESIGYRVAESAGLRLVACERDSVAPRHSSALDALRYFQGVGAVLRGQTGYTPLNPTLTRSLLAHYDRTADAAGSVRTTHKVQYLIAEKR